MAHGVEQDPESPGTRLGRGTGQQRLAVGEPGFVGAKLGEAEVLHADQAQLLQVRVGEAPAPALVEPGAVSQHLPHGLLGVDEVGAFQVRVDQPLDAQGLRTGAVKAERLEDGQAKPVGGKPFAAGCADGTEKRGTEQADKQEVVEVARLQRSVLPVVAEAEQLAPGQRHGTGLLRMHPAQHRMRQQGGRRRAPFCGQRSQPVVVLALGRVGCLARQAEPELAGCEPGDGTRADFARGVDGDLLGAVLARVRLHAQVAVLVFFEPGVGVILILV